MVELVVREEVVVAVGIAVAEAMTEGVEVEMRRVPVAEDEVEVVDVAEESNPKIKPQQPP